MIRLQFTVILLFLLIGIVAQAQNAANSATVNTMPQVTAGESNASKSAVSPKVTHTTTTAQPSKAAQPSASSRSKVATGAATTQAGNEPTENKPQPVKAPPPPVTPKLTVHGQMPTQASNSDPSSVEANTPLELPTKATPAKTSTGGGSILLSILNLLLPLALVLMIAYGVLLGIKKYMHGDLRGLLPIVGSPRPKRILHMLESLSLGQGRSIHIIAVGTRTFLVSATGQHITLLSELSGETAVDELLARSDAEPTAQNVDFRNVLSRFIMLPPAASTTSAVDIEAQPGGDQTSKAALISQIIQARQTGHTRGGDK